MLAIKFGCSFVDLFNDDDATQPKNYIDFCMGLTVVQRYCAACDMAACWPWYNECASLHIYIIQSCDINVKACGCDSLYRTITKFSFLLV